MATEENQNQTDDRWSGFVDPDRSSSSGKKKVVDPGPDLSEFIDNVIAQRSPRKQHERLYKMAASFVRVITSVAYAITSEWKLFLQTTKKGCVRTTDLRTLAGDEYECLVPLKRPLKPDAFQFINKGMDEMPPHRCLIEVNNNLSKEERMLVTNEWSPHIDKQGHLNMIGILRWFNSGLLRASSVVLAESKNISNIRCVTSLDGTAVLHVSVLKEKNETDDKNDNTGSDEPEVENFSVNIYPAFVVDSLPVNVKINTPLPMGRSFGNIQKQIRQAIVDDLDSGRHIIFLEPKREMSNSPIKNCLTHEGPSWAYNMSLTEHHIYDILDEHCGELSYRHVLVLLTIIRELSPAELTVLNTEIIVNSLFVVSQKNFMNLTAIQSWFIELLKYLIGGLTSGFLPSFYLSRQNLLLRYNVSPTDCKIAASKLKEILKAVQKEPRKIYDYTGYVDKKKKRSDDDDSDSDSVDTCSADDVDVNDDQ